MLRDTELLDLLVIMFAIAVAVVLPYGWLVTVLIMTAYCVWS